MFITILMYTSFVYFSSFPPFSFRKQRGIKVLIENMLCLYSIQNPIDCAVWSQSHSNIFFIYIFATFFLIMKGVFPYFCFCRVLQSDLHIRDKRLQEHLIMQLYNIINFEHNQGH